MKEKHDDKFNLHPISKTSITANATNEYDDFNLPEGSMSLDKLIVLRQWERKKMLELYGQSTERFNEMEHTLYLKQQFISKALPYDKDSQCKILNMLLADRGTLFTYGNDGYWNRQVNREIISKHRRLFRDKTLQEELYKNIPALGHNPSDAEKEIHIELLKRITKIAAKKHQSLDTWIKKNIIYETPSIEERMSLVKLSSEYQGEEKSDALQKMRSLITEIIPDFLCRRMLPQSPAYLVAEQNLGLFKEILPEHSDKIDSSFCRTFVNDVLPNHLQIAEWATTLEYRSDHLPECHKIDIVHDFVSYKRRLLQIEIARAKFQQDILPVLEINDLLAFGREPVTGAISSDIYLIEASIISFFCKLNYPLNQDENGYLKQRIKWAMNIQPALGLLRPVFILYMVICCGRRLTLGIDVQIPEKVDIPYCMKRVGWQKQRYEQLLLLDELCNILGITDDDRNQNWTQFLFWQGKNIESEEEFNFWIAQKRKFKFIPGAIDFQLLCRKHLSKCFPIYIENLSYNLCSKLHLGGFLEFWNANHDKIYEQAVVLKERNPQLIKEYFALWKSKDVKKYFFDGVAWLDNLTEESEVSLCSFQEIPDCDLQELKRLILETEFRICVSKEAQKKLAKLLRQTYELSPGLFKAIL